MAQIPGEGGGVQRLLLVLVVGIGVAYLVGGALRGRTDESGMLTLGVVILVIGGFVARKLLRRGEP